MQIRLSVLGKSLFFLCGAGCTLWIYLWNHKLFLQGCGGDAKACVIANNPDSVKFRAGTPEDVEKAGRIVADEVIKALELPFEQIEPDIHTHMIEMNWPLKPHENLDKESLRNFVSQNPSSETSKIESLWAKRQLKRLEEGEYGICENCEEDIDVRRLEARPVTTLCIRCKEEQEQMEKSYIWYL